MTRLLAILLLAAAAAAQDYERAKAVCAEAREIRREKGYAAAIDFLEPRLDHAIIVEAYANCCLWGGEEERGLRGVRGATGVPAEYRVEAEIGLLKRLFRFRDAARLAAAHGWKEAEEYWGEEAALRERLAARARRARWLAALGGALLVGVWAAVRRWTSSAPATA
ncbi:MAG TPA: hypothetical protein VFY93_07595 [Planctomycetota bacterium]|nr:hypothetical protein [Planctomycetota bacterium]